MALTAQLGQYCSGDAKDVDLNTIQIKPEIFSHHLFSSVLAAFASVMTSTSVAMVFLFFHGILCDTPAIKNSRGKNYVIVMKTLNMFLEHALLEVCIDHLGHLMKHLFKIVYTVLRDRSRGRE